MKPVNRTTTSQAGRAARSQYQQAPAASARGRLISIAPRSDLEKIRLEAATSAKFTTLLRLIRDYYRFDCIPFNRRIILSGLKLLVKDETVGRAWLILNRNQPIGYIIATFGFDLEFGGRQATITDFYLEPQHRCNGVGPKALDLVEYYCRERGVRALELQVSQKNSSALKFYTRLGFQAHDRIPMSKRLG